MRVIAAPLLDPEPRVKQDEAKHSETNRQIRGSSLLLTGRLLSVLVGFAIQVMIVRYLSKIQYGAFEYAVSIVAVGETIVTLGLDRAITRFMPIYQEHGEENKLLGTLILAAGTVFALGLAFLLLFYAAYGWISHTLVNDRNAANLLLILIVLSPVQAIDNLLVGLFAVFASPRAIFFRKHVLGPGLKLSAVLLVIIGRHGLFYLAGSYLTAGVLGVALYGAILIRLLRGQGLFRKVDFKSISFPAREVFAFTIPLLTTDLVFTLMNSSDAVILGHYWSANSIAAFRAVQPTARLNQLVLASFGLLFTPLAARLFARRDWKGLNNLYWQTAIWIAVISFPIFALTFSLSIPLTKVLFGLRYSDSAPILALLSLGYYFHAALGANGTTLMVFGKIRYIVLINLFVIFLNIGINLLLIPRFGALGAAFGTGGTLITHNILKQVGLRYCTGIRLFEWAHIKVYLVIAAGALILLAQSMMLHNAFALFLSAGVMSALVLRLNRDSLKVSQTFPELLRFPLIRRFLG